MAASRLAVMMFLAVAGCTSPLERCVDDASRELRAVEEAIRRTEGNIARGYAVHVQTVRQTPVTFCTAVGQSTGNVGIYASTCTDPYRRIETPVAIDVAAEREKLAALRERELALRAETQREINRCYAEADAAS